MTLKEKCEQHWKEIGINSTEGLKEHIDLIFERNTNQHDIIEELYWMVLPEWNTITKIKGYPEAGKKLWKYICSRFQDFDRMFHPDVLPAGAWLNWGYSTNDSLDGWEINFDNCELIYSEALYC
ncbi:hypothetical protein ACFL2E_13500 [Thermodesulfobacteriota bacterium]